MQERIKKIFRENIQTNIAAAEALPDSIEKGATMIAHSLLNGNKILACGNGIAASLAHLLSCQLVNRFEAERPSLPALSLCCDMPLLSAIADDGALDDIYAKQIRALGQAGDVLIAISDDGNARNLIKALEAAVNRDMTIISLTGKDGGIMAGLLSQQDVEIRVPSDQSIRIYEVHHLTLNSLCDLVDHILFPRQDN
ncbi:MAG: DnaA initiator-associating protein DiaA [Candidatus Celerinatantimonas neptuna]|nr:MAG: DnaA initiator-associating protein DiaA [Candidatus Celerinatantimonas neptuna]